MYPNVPTNEKQKKRRQSKTKKLEHTNLAVPFVFVRQLTLFQFCSSKKQDKPIFLLQQYEL